MEKSFVFNSINGDRKYKAEDFRNYFASFIGDGVFPNPSTQLQVISNNNMTITITSGKGFIQGAIYENTDNLILNIDTADGVLNRIDRVILRFDTLERNITCKIKKGTFASNPSPPNLQRDADAYELCIAEVRVDAGAISILQSKITDTRLSSELCGIVTQTVKTIDTTVLYKQLEHDIQEKGLNMQTWLDESKKYFSDWIKEAESFFSNWLGNSKTKFENDFNTWFETIKNILDENTAGNLLNKINDNTTKISDLDKQLSNIDTTAEKTTIKDANNYFVSENVEGALQELGIELNGQKTRGIAIANSLLGKLGR